MPVNPGWPSHEWTAIIVNPADPNQEPEVPYIKLHHDGDPFWLYPGNTTERNAQWRTHGIAMTKLGAKWAARRAWRRHLKSNHCRPPEIIKLRPPSDG